MAIDQQYYEVARPGSIATKVLKLARDRTYRDFLHHMSPSAQSTILDVGVSDVHTEGANWLEVQYPYKQNIHACGLGDAVEFRQHFPEIQYTKIRANDRLPYDDKQFDIATSNAVLEHVGSVENQRKFVSELARVAKRVFISVPHRYFPVEHHTGMPFLHFTDAMFNLACRILGKEKWTEPQNLILISRGHLRELAPSGAKIGYTGIPLGPFSSNLFLSRCE